MFAIIDFNTGRVIASGFESYAAAFVRAAVLAEQGSLPAFIQIVEALPSPI